MKNKRNITILIVGAILLFFVIYFLFFVERHFLQPQNEGNTTSSEVVFEQPKLKVFGQTRYLNEFPDTIRIHYPYLLVISPEEYKRVTTVYDLEHRKEIGTFKDILLDYWQGSVLYNKGEKTFYNQTSLGAKCDQGLIKSNTEILCIVPKSTDPLDNKLVSFNFQTGKEDTLYSSPNLLGSINLINGVLYIGEYNITSKKSFLTANNKTHEVPTQVDIVYPMKDKLYYATFKRSEQHIEAQSYKIVVLGNDISTKQIEEGKIVFYEK